MARTQDFQSCNRSSILRRATMGWFNIIEKLLAGERVTIRPSGNSMTPRIRSKDEVTISPVGKNPIEEGMIVLAKVKGKHYLHLVTAVRGARVQISNNHGHINGWTTKNRVYGIVTKVER
jgi:hypothetical protein